MNADSTTRTATVRCGISASAAIVVVCLAAGCNLPGPSSFTPWHTPPKCVLPAHMSKNDVIDHLNQNANRVHAWRSTDVEISKAGLPIKLSAVVAVQEPMSFRLRAGLVTGNEADLGSNPERFWFWMRRSPQKHVMTCSHEQSAQLQQMVNLPFEPAWLMETLGVIPLDADQFTMLPAAEPEGIMSLVSDRTTPTGETVRRVVQVDMCHGYIVAHELYDAGNRLIARAELNDYKLDRESGASLPHKINLDWPQAGQAMTMTIGSIEVNPRAIPDQTWQVPDIPGYPVLDLGRLTRHAEPPGRARVSGGGFDHSNARRDVRQTGWDETGIAGNQPDTAPAGRRVIRSAEVPEWDNSPSETEWRQPRQQTTPGTTGESLAHQAHEEPPWDASPATMSPDPRAGSMQLSPEREIAGGDAKYAAGNEEPPWDMAATAPEGSNEDDKPSGMLDLIKAPFVRFVRGN